MVGYLLRLVSVIFWIYLLCHVCGLINCLHYFVFRVTPVVLSYAKTPTIPHAGTWAASCPGASSAPTPAYLASTRTYLNIFPGLRSRSSCTMMMMPSLKTCKGNNRRSKLEILEIFNETFLTLRSDLALNRINQGFLYISYVIRT